MNDKAGKSDVEIVKHKLFLKWWLTILLIAIFTGFCFFSNIFHTVWDNDVTKLSFVILLLFYTQSIICGIQTWSVGYIKQGDPTRRDLKEKIESGWFMSDLFLSIGMVGTVIGFISMLGGFATLNVDDTQTVQALIRDLGLGMSTALYTTLVGLVCSIFLKIQYFILGQGVDGG